MTKDDLMKNRSGKIVSKRKSFAMKKVNNLGDFLRKKGDPFAKPPKPVVKKKVKKAVKAKIAVKPKPTIAVKPKSKPKAPTKVKEVLVKATKAAKKQSRAARVTIDLTGSDVKSVEKEPDFFGLNLDDF